MKEFLVGRSLNLSLFFLVMGEIDIFSLNYSLGA